MHFFGINTAEVATYEFTIHLNLHIENHLNRDVLVMLVVEIQIG